jgi:O-methyltransferase involved in polyketide biosynthesis
VSEDWLRATSRPVKKVHIDTAVPNVARVWNFLIGGRDNFDADRRAATQLLSVAPMVAYAAPASRAFLRRSVGYLAAEAGIRQFLDIGTGIPTAGNTHEVAQGIDPACRVVYVDNDPVVLSHARAMLRSSTGGVAFLDADANQTAALVAGARATLDFAKPVAVIMIDVLNFLEDADQILANLVRAVPSGSYLALMQPTEGEGFAAAARRWNGIAKTPVFLRDRAAIARWLTGLHLVEPGIVEVNRWRPTPDDPESPGRVPLLGAVARKP